MTPDQYCQEKAARSGSSFYYSFLFLPPARRSAITALYAFCREVDDIADKVSDANVARAKLGFWRSEIENVFNGVPQHPVGLALKPAVAAYGLQRRELDAVIDGMEMDLLRQRYSDFDALTNYCWHVASAVGLSSARIFGVTRNETLRFAERLGLALQLTNIIRDVGEDARRNRIYLPESEMRAFAVEPSNVLSARYGDEFTALMRSQAQRAHRTYDEALALLPPEDRKAQRPGLVMAAIYRTLLREIERDDFRVLHQRIALTPLRKFWIAWKTWVFA